MKNNVLEKKFIKFLQNKSIKVISFDIFETLAFRKVNKPTDIFTLVGKNKYVKKIYDKEETFQYYRIQAEKQARKNNLTLEDVTLELIYNELPLTKEQRKKIIQLELNEEYKSLYINKQIEKWIKKATNAGKKVVLTSDMYLSKKELQKLVTSKLSDEKRISKIYVSNRYNATKSTGHLYPIVLDDLGITPKELLHIGDNKYSDIQMAEEQGLHSLHYSCDKYVQEVLEIESNYIKHYTKNNNYRVQATLLNPYNNEDERFFFNLGATIFGPILWEFSHWINQLAKDNNISQVNCIMREGRIFSKYIQKINKDLDVNTIYASRKSTFLPAININKLNKNGFDFYKYRNFTIQNFYDLFKIKITNAFIKQRKNDLLVVANKYELEGINLLDLITADFQNQINDVMKNVNNEKILFKEYLQQFSYSDNSILIDFGGTGSILENISDALGSQHVQKLNVLFYMHSSGFEKMLPQKTLTFLPFTTHTQQKLEKLRRSPEFIEILFNGVNQTTLHYQKRKGKVKAITDFPYSDIEYIQMVSQAFDKGIDNFFKITKQYGLSKNLYSSEVILDFIARLISIPNITEANNLGNLQHDEGYGSALIEKVIMQEHINFVKNTGIKNAYFKHSSNLSYLNGKIPWLQGVITKINKHYISDIHNLRVKGINADSIEKIMEILNENPHISEVYIYGAGKFFIELYPRLKNKGIHVKGLIDTKAQFKPFQVGEFKVNSLENTNIKDKTTIIVSSDIFALEITKTIINFAKKKQYNLNIINFYNQLLSV